ncbi:DUF6479 family protein [Streptomyces sp. NPDC003077]|uniref:DUF6479 family protein n=1 Tax=Streptomyces sp. NPDC003077 TaxID=3154443 RepID=UPI0033A3EDCA
MTALIPQVTQPVELAASHDFFVGIGPALVGIIVVILLILAVAFGWRRRRREPAPPRPQDQPRPPTDPRGYETGNREPDEVPRSDERMLPHEFKGSEGTRPGDPNKEQSPWQEGHSGSFGNG